LLQALKTPPELELDQRAGLQDFSQRRLKDHLTQPHVGFQRLGAVVAGANVVAPFMNVGVFKAGEFPLREARDPGDIHAMVPRDCNVANSLGDA
jgi:hypothetical protein